MSKRRRSRSRSSSFSASKKRTGLRTLIETVMGIAAALIILAGLYWWVFVREVVDTTAKTEDTAAAVKDNIVDNTASFEAIRDGGDLDQMRALLMDLENWPRDAATPVRLQTVSQRLEIAEKVIQHPDLTEEQRVFAAKAILQSMGLYYGISLDEGILDDGSTVSRYLDVCNTFLNDKSEEVSREAQLAKAKVQVLELTRGNDSGSNESILQTISSLIERFPDDPAVIANIRLMIGKVNASDPRAGAKLFADVITAYERESVTQPEVLRQLRMMKDLLVLNESGFGRLASEAKASGNYEQYLRKLEELLNEPDTGVDFVNLVYNEIGYFEMIGRHDLAKRILEQLKNSALKNTNEAAQLQGLRVVKFGLIRNELVGKPIDLNENDSNGNPIDVSRLTNRPVILLFYSPNAPRTSDVFNNLRFTYELIRRTGVQVIAVAVEKANAEKFESGFDPSWISVDSSIEDTSKIFLQCPVSHVPYFVIIDRNGVVDSLNVPADQLKTKIEALEASAVNAGR